MNNFLELTKRIAEKEGKKQEVNIAQINEVVKITLQELAKMTLQELALILGKYGNENSRKSN